jgi:hypothetical protein
MIGEVFQRKNNFSSFWYLILSTVSVCVFLYLHTNGQYKIYLYLRYNSPHDLRIRIGKIPS